MPAEHGTDLTRVSIGEVAKFAGYVGSALRANGTERGFFNVYTWKKREQKLQKHPGA